MERFVAMRGWACALSRPPVQDQSAHAPRELACTWEEAHGIREVGHGASRAACLALKLCSAACGRMRGQGCVGGRQARRANSPAHTGPCARAPAPAPATRASRAHRPPAPPAPHCQSRVASRPCRAAPGGPRCWCCSYAAWRGPAGARCGCRWRPAG